MSKYL